MGTSQRSQDEWSIAHDTEFVIVSQYRTTGYSVRRPCRWPKLNKVLTPEVENKKNKTTQNFTLVVGGRNSKISLETRTQVPFKVEHLLIGTYTLSSYIYILIHRQHRPIIWTLRGCRQVDCCQFRNESVYAVSSRPTEVTNSETLFQKLIWD